MDLKGKEEDKVNWVYKVKRKTGYIGLTRLIRRQGTLDIPGTRHNEEDRTHKIYKVQKRNSGHAM